MLAQKITGTPNIDVFRSVQLGAIGAGLDIFRQDIAANSGGNGERIAKVAKTVSSQAVWAPMVACAFYAALKVAEGNPGEIVQGLEVRYTSSHFSCLANVPQVVLLCSVGECAPVAYQLPRSRLDRRACLAQNLAAR